MKRGLFYKGSMMVSFEKEPYETRARLQRRRGACVCISSKHSELYNGVFTVNTAESWCVAVCCSVLQVSCTMIAYNQYRRELTFENL